MDFRSLVQNKTLAILIGISLLFLIITSILIYINMDSLSYPLILHFNSFQGVDMVGELQDLWKIVIVGGLISIINTVLASLLYFRERVLAYIILVVNVFITLIALIGVSNIISLN